MPKIQQYQRDSIRFVQEGRCDQYTESMFRKYNITDKDAELTEPRTRRSAANSRQSVYEQTPVQILYKSELTRGI